VIVVVFTDLSTDRAQGVFDDVLQQLAVPRPEVVADVILTAAAATDRLAATAGR